MVITLLPLIPAYVLFATLKSQATVTGPFSGLKIQLGGAFAAYFLVLVAVSWGMGSAIDPFHYHSWTIKGRVQASSGAKPNYTHINTYMRPPDFSVRRDGTFEFEVPVRELSNGQLRWPQLSMEMDGFEPGFVYLYEPANEPGFGAELIPEHYDRINRVIELRQPVMMRSKSDSKPYDPIHAQSPTPLASAGTQ